MTVKQVHRARLFLDRLDTQISTLPPNDLPLVNRVCTSRAESRLTISIDSSVALFEFLSAAAPAGFIASRQSALRLLLFGFGIRRK